MRNRESEGKRPPVLRCLIGPATVYGPDLGSTKAWDQSHPFTNFPSAHFLIFRSVCRCWHRHSEPLEPFRERDGAGGLWGLEAPFSEAPGTWPFSCHKHTEREASRLTYKPSNEREAGSQQCCPASAGPSLPIPTFLSQHDNRVYAPPHILCACWKIKTLEKLPAFLLRTEVRRQKKLPLQLGTKSQRKGWITLMGFPEAHRSHSETSFSGRRM